jgi:hypothetical protein
MITGNGTRNMRAQEAGKQLNINIDSSRRHFGRFLQTVGDIVMVLGLSAPSDHPNAHDGACV